MNEFLGRYPLNDAGFPDTSSEDMSEEQILEYLTQIIGEMYIATITKQQAHTDDHSDVTQDA